MRISEMRQDKGKVAKEEIKDHFSIKRHKSGMIPTNTYL